MAVTSFAIQQVEARLAQLQIRQGRINTLTKRQEEAFALASALADDIASQRAEVGEEEESIRQFVRGVPEAVPPYVLAADAIFDSFTEGGVHQLRDIGESLDRYCQYVMFQQVSGRDLGISKLGITSHGACIGDAHIDENVVVVARRQDLSLGKLGQQGGVGITLYYELICGDTLTWQHSPASLFVPLDRDLFHHNWVSAQTPSSERKGDRVCNTLVSEDRTRALVIAYDAQEHFRRQDLEDVFAAVKAELE